VQTDFIFDSSGPKGAEVGFPETYSMRGSRVPPVKILRTVPPLCFESIGTPIAFFS
jgi:hypothetical protein